MTINAPNFNFLAAQDAAQLRGRPLNGTPPVRTIARQRASRLQPGDSHPHSPGAAMRAGLRRGALLGAPQAPTGT